MDDHSIPNNMNYHSSAAKPHYPPHNVTEDKDKKADQREHTHEQSTRDNGSGPSTALSPKKPYRGRVQDRPSGG